MDNVMSLKTYLLYDVAVIQRITSCHKNRSHALTLKRHVIDKSPCQQYVPFEIMFILTVIKSRFDGSCDVCKQNPSLVAISYKIYQLAKGSFHKSYTISTLV